MNPEHSKHLWYEGTVVYQIYPLSFKDSNGDGRGDLRGIIEKLDYLAGSSDSLGIGAIWLSPIYSSPMRDGGYDISDYCNIDAMFGTLEDFDLLVKECHRRGIKVLMDFVTNHTSSDHPWFLESSSSRDNPKRDWYVWKKGKANGLPPTNWLSVFGGSAWELDPKTDQYYLHHFLKEQPDLNWKNPEVLEEMNRVISFWLNRGVDGFRVDAANHIIEDSQFRDDEPAVLDGEGLVTRAPFLYSRNRPEIKEVINFLCDITNQHPGEFFVTEAYFTMEEMLSIYDGCGAVIPFNFNLLQLPWNAKKYRAFISAYDAALGLGKLPNYVFGNHDQQRIASRLGPERARICAMMLLTLRGMPFIYYGEELGMTDVQIPTDAIRDGFAKQSKNSSQTRDPARTPLPWSKEKYAGFSVTKPWLPPSDNAAAISVESQQRDPFSFLHLYQQLISFRNNSKTLRYGKFNPIEEASNAVFSYKREHEGEKLLIVLNFSGDPVEEKLSSEGEIILSTTLKRVREPVKGKISLAPLEGCLVKLKEST